MFEIISLNIYVIIYITYKIYKCSLCLETIPSIVQYNTEWIQKGNYRS